MDVDVTDEAGVKYAAGEDRGQCVTFEAFIAMKTAAVSRNKGAGWLVVAKRADFTYESRMVRGCLRGGDVRKMRARAIDRCTLSNRRNLD
jgi:hypothetical protein